MIEKLYTNKCTALVGENGRALSGEALEAAEKAMRSACSSQYKLWSAATRNSLTMYHFVYLGR